MLWNTAFEVLEGHCKSGIVKVVGGLGHLFEHTPHSQVHHPVHIPLHLVGVSAREEGEALPSANPSALEAASGANCSVL
jgi:hypothetical protein